MKPSPIQTGKAVSTASSNLTAPTRAPAARQRPKPIQILVPIDFSQPARFPLRVAADFARQYGGRITLVTVIEPDPFHHGEANALAVSRKTFEGRLRSELSDFGNQFAGLGRIEAVLIRNGKPFEQIVKTARGRKSSLIIIATHGHTGLKRVLLGSTAERVIRYAPCPVLTVREGQRQGWPNNYAD